MSTPNVIDAWRLTSHPITPPEPGCSMQEVLCLPRKAMRRTNCGREENEVSSRKQPSISPISLIRSLGANRDLVFALAKREIVGRYRGSFMGLMWSFFHPLLMLAVYTFVFSVVFNARWQEGGDSKTEFALVLFTGLIVFGLFSECLNRAPSVIVGNVSYVKKVVFPLEMLPVVTLLSAGFHMLVSIVVWFGFYFIFFGVPPITILLLPLVLVPLVLTTLGFSWLLASLGVYLRDVVQITGVFTTILMFMSPIFYSIEALPEEYRAFMLANPLTTNIEQVRDVMIWGKEIDWMAWAVLLAGSMVTAWVGFAWFQKTRTGFADVL